MQQPLNQQSGWTQVHSPAQNARQTGSVPPPAQLDPAYEAPFQPPVYGAPEGWQGAPYQQHPGNTSDQAAQQGAARERQPEADPLSGEPAPQRDTQNPGKPGYHVPRTGVIARKKRSGTPYIVLAILLLGVGAFAAIRYFAPQEAVYGYVSAGTLSSRYAGQALIVRDETVFTQEGVSQIDYTANEGEPVNRATIICTVYTSGFNTRELTTLKKYRDQIKEYHKTLISSTGAAKDARLTTLDTQVKDQARSTRTMIQEGKGNLINQENLLTLALQQRQSYLRQKYPDDQKLSRLYDDENTQLQRISSWTKQYAANSDGIVSFYTDGYEPSLNLSTYRDFSPAAVRNMINGQVPRNPAATRNTVSIYRLVKDGSWAVLMLCSDPDWTPINGQTYKLLIESFENTVVDATVESFTRSGGELLVRLLVPVALECL